MFEMSKDTEWISITKDTNTLKLTFYLVCSFDGWFVCFGREHFCPFSSFLFFSGDFCFLIFSLCYSFLYFSFSIRFIMRHKCVRRRYVHRLFRNRSFLNPLIFRSLSHRFESTLLRIPCYIYCCDSVSFCVVIQWFFRFCFIQFYSEFLFADIANNKMESTNCILLYALQWTFQSAFELFIDIYLRDEISIILLKILYDHQVLYFSAFEQLL